MGTSMIFLTVTPGFLSVGHIANVVEQKSLGQHPGLSADTDNPRSAAYLHGVINL